MAVYYGNLDEIKDVAIHSDDPEFKYIFDMLMGVVKLDHPEFVRPAITLMKWKFTICVLRYIYKNNIEAVVDSMHYHSFYFYPYPCKRTSTYYYDWFAFNVDYSGNPYILLCYQGIEETMDFNEHDIKIIKQALTNEEILYFHLKGILF